MPTKKKFFGKGSVTIPTSGGTPKDKDVRWAAKQLGIPPQDIIGIVELSNAIRDEIEVQESTPPQIISACLAIASECIGACYKTEDREKLCADIFTQLRYACDLKDN